MTPRPGQKHHQQTSTCHIHYVLTAMQKKIAKVQKLKARIHTKFSKKICRIIFSVLIATSRTREIIYTQL